MRDFLSRAYKNDHARHWVGILALLAVSVASVNSVQFSSYLQSSVLDTPEHAPFDGTVLPFDKVPDWSRLSGAEYKYSYSEMLERIPGKLIDMPLYDNDLMTASSEGLGWRDPDDLALRTFKVLYPVGYLDDYDYSNNSGDYSGGHDGVDIKVPAGTPILSIANGVVIESGWSSGNGNHIVIKTEDAPDPKNPSRTRTLYASYSHNSQNFVAEGEVVNKGQVIGEVGATGTATTNHLHLQLDDEEAPFTPYWPFTSQDAARAGVDFWEGVNIGLGKDNVLRYSHHPFDWIQSHLNGAEPRPNQDQDDYEEPEEDISEDEEEPERTPKPSIPVNDVRMNAPQVVLTGSNTRIQVQLYDQNGALIEEPDFDGELALSLSDSSLGRLSRTSLDANNFEDGIAIIKFYAEQAGDVALITSIGDLEYQSSTIQIAADVKPFAGLDVRFSGGFNVGVPKAIQVRTLDENGVVTSDFQGDGRVEFEITSGSATVEPSSLGREDFNQGVATVYVTSTSTDALGFDVVYGSIRSQSVQMLSQLFSDLSDTSPYYTAVKYLNGKGVLTGYPDGTVRLENPISRVEVLKLIFMGTEKEVIDGINVNFPDTSNNEWYAPFLGTAFQDGIVEGYPDGSFKPTQGVNRSEFLKMLLVTASRSESMNVSVDPVVTENPYSDVDRLAWFAPYVHYTKVYNLFPIVEGSFDPARLMTRGEVAEVLYRLNASQQNDSAPYSVLLGTQ